ncbi:MAG: pyridoxamine 5'-phosphate oxidase family protein [Actinomycetota bacterium]|nr:pyridoxamine 5'-phosphate oxidase family protein [Actinomycetota bacterium]
MTASLPEHVQQVFARFITTEYTTVDARGHPITWPVTPYYRPGAGAIDVTTGLGYPKKANDARANPQVALLFSDPTGSGLEEPPAVLVQGTAKVDDADLDANAERYRRESLKKLPATKSQYPPKFLQRFFTWYFARLYVYVRPERVFVWSGGDVGAEPQLLDSRLEEVRSGHSEEPAEALEPPEGGAEAWDERMDELGARHPTAVLSYVAPDGFPFSARVPIEVDRAAQHVRIGAEPLGCPVHPGLACLTAHAHDPEFEWQVNFQVRGDLVRDGDGWTLVPHKLVGGFELPPGSTLGRYRANLAKMRRFHRNAKRELARRSG